MITNKQIASASKYDHIEFNIILNLKNRFQTTKIKEKDKKDAKRLIDAFKR